MNHSETILIYMKKNHGYITNKQVKDLSVPTIYLKRMQDDKKINKIERGIYVLPSVLEDELFIYYLRYKKIVYTGNTALVLNDLSNRSLKEIEANVLYRYNTHRISNLKVHRVNDIRYSLGRTMKRTQFGNLVPTYNQERVICEIFIDDVLDNEGLNYAINMARSRKIDYERLYEYAVKLNIYEKIKLLLELRNDN